MDIRLKPFIPSGKIPAQPSKSDAHRKLICAAFAGRNSSVDNIVLSEDISATIGALRGSGCSMDVSESTLYPGRNKIISGGFTKEIPEVRRIDCQESGSTLRFLSMVFAMVGGRTVFTGSGRLPERPMEHAMEFYKKYGIDCRISGQGKYLPMEISGRAEGNIFEMDASVSSQFVSGLLMGIAASKRNAFLRITGKYESRGYVEMTKRILESYGISIKGDDCLEINAAGGIRPFEDAAEGDWSNASYFLVMNKLCGAPEVTDLDKFSLQPDRAMTEILNSLSVEKDNMVDVGEYPDIMPSIAVYAATLPVNTTIAGKRLRFKESDRIKSVRLGLEALGIEAVEMPEGLVIHGKEHIGGGMVDSCNDHRIAMAFSSLSCRAGEDIIIRGADCIDKSYPEFFKDMQKVGGKIL